MASLIADLVPLIVNDKAILFIGTDLNWNPERPSTQDLFRQSLLKRFHYGSEDVNLPKMASAYERHNSRAGLIQVYREIIETYHGEVQPPHHLVARIAQPGTRIVTSRVDHVLEDALEQQNKPSWSIVHDAEVPFLDDSRVTIIKIRGDIERPDSLVLTVQDISDFIDKLPGLSDVVRALFATRRLIFMGYDLNDSVFERYFSTVTERLRMYQRKAYAIVNQPLDSEEIDRWRYEKNVEVHYRPDLIRFLDELANRVQAERQQPTVAEPEIVQPPLPKNPYKLLNSYGEEDAAIYFGRDEEKQRLTNRILAHRVGLLYGESGAGKTSLLQAGVGPILRDQYRSVLVTVTPATGRPIADQLHAGLRAELARQEQTFAEEESLHDLVKRWQRTRTMPIIFAIDQFEQFFLVYDADTRRSTVDFLRSLCEDRSLDLRLLFVLREDFFGRMENINEVIPDLLQTRFHLERLGREAARSAITEPARLYDASWETELVERLLDELYVDNRGVAPPQLQIVCSRLYAHVRMQSDDAHISIGIADLRELEDVAAILQGYLVDTVDSFPEEQRPTVKLLLGALVTTNQVKQRLPLTELARVAGVSHVEAAEILDTLTDKWLLQRYVGFSVGELGEGDRVENAAVEYELIHDYLVAPIIDWLGEEFWDVQRAREILRMTLPRWKTRQRLLQLDDVRLVHQYDNQLRVSHAEAELLYASTAANSEFADDLIETWKPEVTEGERQTILLDLVKHPEPSVREQSARYVGTLDDPVLASSLAQRVAQEPLGEVRLTASKSLSCMAQRQDDTIQDALSQLSKYVASDNGEVAQQAEDALVRILDDAPAVGRNLDPGLRRRLKRRVWAVRWRRHRADIRADYNRGAVGGLIGLGLGLGVYVGSTSPTSASISLAWTLLLDVFGFVLVGFFGLVVGAGAGFVGSFTLYLSDRPSMRRVWFATMLTGTMMMAIAVFMSDLLLSELELPTGAASLVGGAIAGFAFTGVGTAPFPAGNRLRLAVAAIGGVIAGLLLINTGLISVQTTLQMLIICVVGSIAFTVGLAPIIVKSGRRSRTPR